MKTKTELKRRRDDKALLLLLVAIVVVIVFQILNKNYLSSNNIRALLNSASATGTLAVGLTCLMISGQIDLSSGSVGCISGIIITLIMGDGSTFGIPWPLALIIILALGAATGLVVTFFVNVLNISAFIATLAMSSIYHGLAKHLSHNQTLPVKNPDFWILGESIGVIPTPFLIMLLLFVIYGVILSRSKFGRKIYMCGGNPNAARLAGINQKRMHAILFINNGAIAALAGALLAARMRSAGFNSLIGSDIEAITVIVLGGIAFTGGKGTMAGCFVGLLLLTCVKNGLIGLRMPTYGQILVQGLTLIIALTFDFLREKSLQKSLKASIEKG